MKELLSFLVIVKSCAVLLLLAANGWQRIIHYGDWPQGLQSVGIASILALALVGALADRK